MTIANKIPVAARSLLGIIFVVFGLNFFLHFIPMPPSQGEAAAFMGAMHKSGYLMEMVHAVEVICGAALLINFFTPLALTVLAPIIVNIIAFHLRFAPEGLPLPAVILALELYLAWAYRHAFEPMLRPKVAPDPVAHTHKL
jgi:putative oxidoreductase